MSNHKIYRAYFSSELGGITTETAFMAIHVDDHLAHRSCIISQTSTITHGNVYLLNQCLDRFFLSALAMHIDLVYPKEKIRKIILETCAASLVSNGEVQFWISYGRGSKVSNTQKQISSFYVLVIDMGYSESEMPNFDERWRVITCSTPMKSGIIPEIETRNSLENMLCSLESENSNAQLGIFLNSDGFVVGYPGLDLLAYTGDKRLIVPVTDDYSPNCNTHRILQLVNQFLAQESPSIKKDYEWLFENVKSAEFVSPMRQDEIRDIASELFLVGGHVILIPIFQWDEEWVGNQFIQTNSELYQVIFKLIKLDMTYPGYDSSLLTRVPYSE